MSAARDAVLCRIRSALGDAPAQPDMPRDYRPAGSGAADAALFCERVADYHATVHRVAAGELPAALAEACRRHDARRIATTLDTGVDGVELVRDDPPLGYLQGARRLLGRRLRLAHAGGEAQRAAPVRHLDRRPGHPLPARPLARAGRVTPDPDPRLAQLAGGVPEADRSAERSSRARRRPAGAFHTDGYIRVGGRYHWGVEDVFSIKGGLDLELFGSKFNASAQGDACIDFVDFCRGMSTVISSKGVAVCLSINFWIGTWEPGIGYIWGESSPDLYFDGCDVGDYKEHIDRATASAAAVGEQSIEIKDGLPGTVIAAKGKDAPPKITLIGPKGERITTPDGLTPVEDERYFPLKDPRASLTQVAINAPTAGAGVSSSRTARRRWCRCAPPTDCPSPRSRQR